MPTIPWARIYQRYLTATFHQSMMLYALIRNLICLLGFLYIPEYFVLQARGVLPDCVTSRIVSVSGESEDEEFISLITIPSAAYTAPGRRAWGTDVPSMVSSLDPVQPIRKYRNTTLESGWTTCVDYWCKIWRVTASVSFTILVASAALLQMPGTSGDPLTRCFVFLFILRLVPALLSAGVLLYYFSKEYFRSETFVLIWYQNVKRHHNSCFYMPWIIVALPVVAISWGAIFMLVAVFLSVWGDGLDPNLSAVEKVSLPTALSLRVIITAMSVIDVGWVLWLAIRLRAFDKAVNAAAQVSAV